MYDELDIGFIYVGQFSRFKFAEIKQEQGLMFDADKAPEKIINFIKKLNESNLNFINCTIENKEKEKNICR